MSQYTDYIKQASQDFAEISEYEKLSCLHAIAGRLETHYNHGGMRITILRDNIEYEGIVYAKDDVIDIPPTDEYYLKLKEKWEPKSTKRPLLLKLFKFLKITG